MGSIATSGSNVLIVNSTQDLTVALATLQAGTGRSYVYLEEGTYEMSEDLVIPRNVSLIAIDQQTVRLVSDDAQIARNVIYSGSHSEALEEMTSISGIIFDNVAVALTGGSVTANINENIFINTAPQKTSSDQLFLAHGQFSVDSNIFLANIAPDTDEIAVRGLGTYKTHSSNISGNTVGNLPADLLSKAGISETLAGIVEGSSPLDQIDFDLHFTGFGGSQDMGLRVSDNAIFGSETTDFARDHAIYYHHFDGLVLTGNNFSGWPLDPSGGVKIRNGESLIFADNNLIDISLLLFAYDSGKTGLSDVAVYGNDFLTDKPGLVYWEDGNSMRIDDFYVSNNTFFQATGDAEMLFLPNAEQFKVSDGFGEIHFWNNFTVDMLPAQLRSREYIEIHPETSSVPNAIFVQDEVSASSIQSASFDWTFIA